MSPRHGIRYSNNEFNYDGKSVCISLYDEKSKTTVNGFEDGGDNDYRDVLFYLNSTPEEAIYDPNKPTTDPDEEYPPLESDPLEGTLVFEDLWPSQGDYDMNDVVLTYHTVFTTDKDNKITGIKDIFTPIHSGGVLKSAFGYQLDMDKNNISNVKIDNASSTAIQNSGMEVNQELPTFMLFDDIQQAVKNGPITVVLELKGNKTIHEISRKNSTTHSSVSTPKVLTQQAKRLVGKSISRTIPRPRLPIYHSSDVIMIKAHWIKEEILSAPITMSPKIIIPSQ